MYFTIKRDIKKIYKLGMKAVKRQDVKYINYLVSNLEDLGIKLNTETNLNNLGKSILKKEIDQVYTTLLKLRGALNE